MEKGAFTSSGASDASPEALGFFHPDTRRFMEFEIGPSGGHGTDVRGLRSMESRNENPVKNLDMGINRTLTYGIENVSYLLEDSV